MHLCTPSISGFVFALMVLGFLWLTLPFFPFFNINLKIYHSASYSPGFSLRRLHLKVTGSWLVVGAPEPFVAPSIFQSPEHSNEAILLFIPKYFWSQLYVCIIFFSPTNIPSLYLAFCHPMIPCQWCFALTLSLSLALSVFLSPPSSLAPTVSPGEAALLPTPRWKATADNKNAI